MGGVGGGVGGWWRSLSHANMKMIYPMDIAIISSTFLSYENRTIHENDISNGYCHHLVHFLVSNMYCLQKDQDWLRWEKSCATRWKCGKYHRKHHLKPSLQGSKWSSARVYVTAYGDWILPRKAWKTVENRQSSWQLRLCQFVPPASSPGGPSWHSGGTSHITSKRLFEILRIKSNKTSI